MSIIILPFVWVMFFTTFVFYGIMYLSYLESLALFRTFQQFSNLKNEQFLKEKEKASTGSKGGGNLSPTPIASDNKTSQLQESMLKTIEMSEKTAEEMKEEKEPLKNVKKLNFPNSSKVFEEMYDIYLFTFNLREKRLKIWNINSVVFLAYFALTTWAVINEFVLRYRGTPPPSFLPLSLSLARSLGTRCIDKNSDGLISLLYIYSVFVMSLIPWIFYGCEITRTYENMVEIVEDMCDGWKVFNGKEKWDGRGYLALLRLMKKKKLHYHLLGFQISYLQLFKSFVYFISARILFYSLEYAV